MSRKFMFLSILMLVLAFAIAGCSDDDDNGTGPGDETTEDFQIDATSYDSYGYFNLVTGLEVELTDEEAASSSDWHIAFRRYEGKLNSGISGPLTLTAADLVNAAIADGDSFEAILEVPSLTDDDWIEDTELLVFDGWYDYDFQTHVVSPSGRLFAFRTADGHYAKVTVTDISVGGMGILSGVELKYVYDSGTTGDLSGDAVFVSLSDDDSDNQMYFSFAEGGAVAVTDPSTSSDWDIWFDGFDVMVNGGTSGPGSAGIYPIYLEDPTNDFDALTSSPPDVGGSYQTDTISSIFDEWYDYTDLHEILSKDHVYIIKVDDTMYYKLQITNYYKVVDGSPVSGWISFQYEEL